MEANTLTRREQKKKDSEVSKREEIITEGDCVNTVLKKAS